MFSYQFSIFNENENRKQANQTDPKRKVSLKAKGKKRKFKMLDFKEKPEEQGDAFLIDILRVWSDENFENFFRKE